MAVVLSVRELSKSFGSDQLFEDLSFSIEEGDRLAIIGPNGSGKSTLLSILADVQQADAGQRVQRRDSTLAYVAQNDPADERSVTDVLAAALGSAPEHTIEATVARLLALGGFVDAQQASNTLSGGWRKRLAICAALAEEPDILLLDEPTNHLDLAGRLWLEDLLTNSKRTCVLVSHDRWFLDAVATRVLEVHPRFPEGFFNAAGNYGQFLERRQEFVTGLMNRQASLANKHKREQAWLARQPKARTTKNQARIKGAQELDSQLNELAHLNRQERSAGIAFTASGRRSNDLVVIDSLSVERGDRCLFRDLELTISPGSCLGLLGGNGSGKSSLMQCILGSLKAQAGSIKKATDLRVATFDQTREALDTQATLLRALAPNGSSVHYQDREWHVNAWADRFLFAPHQLDQQVSTLSGGEQARLLIAQLMLSPADVLLLDEPTNDLDIPALEILEQSLLDFPGGILLVTHDRYLLDKVCDSCLALHGDGNWQRVGDYRQWEKQQRQAHKTTKTPAKSGTTESASEASKADTATSLTYAEQKELRGLEGRIEKAENKLAEAQEALADEAVYTDPSRLQEAQQNIATAQTKVDELYARWEELEGKS